MHPKCEIILLLSNCSFYLLPLLFLNLHFLNLLCSIFHSSSFCNISINIILFSFALHKVIALNHLFFRFGTSSLLIFLINRYIAIALSLLFAIVLKTTIAITLVGRALTIERANKKRSKELIPTITQRRFRAITKLVSIEKSLIIHGPISFSPTINDQQYYRLKSCNIAM